MKILIVLKSWYYYGNRLACVVYTIKERIEEFIWSLNLSENLYEFLDILYSKFEDNFSYIVV